MNRKSLVVAFVLAVPFAIDGLWAGPPKQQDDRQQPNGDRITASAPVTDAGIELSIVSVSSDDADAITLQLAFENVSKEDTVLNLGEMLENGKVQLPTELRLTLTDESGRSRELHFSDKRHPGVAGRVDDYIIALRAGSTYSLTLNMKNVWCPHSKELSIGFSPQEYTVRASFSGQGARFLNGDTEGLKHMPFFIGTVRSQATSFRVAKKG